jgi:DNA (cytosine-5)-methyltransferase 1
MSDKIGIFSFFAGAGFLDLGFEMTGHFKTLFVNEFHKPFMDVYKGSRKRLCIEEREYGDHVDDITTYLQTAAIKQIREQVEESRHTYPLVGFIGGPPCPDFSIGGKNRGTAGENGKLSGTYIELICKTSPDFFLFENVKGLYRTVKHRLFFEEVKLKLINAGYYLTEKVINALEFGAPQDRERIILIGFKRSVLKDFGFKVNGSPIIKNFNWEAFTDYKSEDVFKYNWPKQDPFEIDSDKPLTLNVPEELTVEHWFKQNQVNNHPNAIHHFTPRAGLSRFLKIEEGDDLKKSYKRLHRWRYSPTAAYGNNEVHLHPYKARRISAAEALAIQSLPREFVLPEQITLSDMFKTIGNGVPFLAAKGLAKTIYSFLNDNPIKDLKEPYDKANSLHIS